MALHTRRPDGTTISNSNITKYSGGGFASIHTEVDEAILDRGDGFENSGFEFEDNTTAFIRLSMSAGPSDFISQTANPLEIFVDVSPNVVAGSDDEHKYYIAGIWVWCHSYK